MLSLWIVPAASVAAALWLRRRGLHWTWALAAAAAAYPLTETALGLAPLAATAVAGALGARWHGADVRAGGDLARTAAQRTGPLHALRVRHRRNAAVIDAGGLLVGFDRRGPAARIPFGAAGGP